MNNIAIGSRTLHQLTMGAGNTSIGTRSGSYVTEGFGNVFIGESVGGVTTGSLNILIGAGSVGGRLTTGNNNIIFGLSADVPSSNTSYFLNIENTIFGDTSLKKVRIGGSGDFTGETSTTLRVEGTSALTIATSSGSAGERFYIDSDITYNDHNGTVLNNKGILSGVDTFSMSLDDDPLVFNKCDEDGGGRVENTGSYEFKYWNGSAFTSMLDMNRLSADFLGNVTAGGSFGLTTPITEPSSPSTGSVVYVDSTTERVAVKDSNGIASCLEICGEQVVEVWTPDDFGPVTGGRHRLSDGYKYIIKAPLVMTNGLKFPVGSRVFIQSDNFLHNTITYTGATVDFFYSTGMESIILQDLFVVITNAAVAPFDLALGGAVSAGDLKFSQLVIFCSNSGPAGSIRGVPRGVAELVLNFASAPLLLDDVSGTWTIGMTHTTGLANTYIEVKSASAVNIVFDRCSLQTLAGETVFDIDATAQNANSSVIIKDSETGV